MHDSLDRRDFLRVAGGAALASALADLLAGDAVVGVAHAQGAPSSEVTVVGIPSVPTQAQIDARVREAVFAATDLSWLKPGQLVAVKVASNSAKPYPFTTHPGALKAVVKLLRERGARVVVADQPGFEWVMAPFGLPDDLAAKVRALWGTVHSGYANGRDVMKANGLLDAALEAGAEVRTFDRSEDWLPPGPPQKHWPKGFRIAKIARDAEHFVNLARPSGHVMAGHTGPVKTWYGWLHLDDRLWSHTDVAIKKSGPEVKNLHECVAEVALAFKPKTRLNLVTAIGTYSDIGPDWGAQPLQSSMVLASTDMVAIDSVTAALVAYEKSRVPESERKKNWKTLPWYRKLLQPLKDEAFMGSIEGLVHRFHGTKAWDDLVASPKEKTVFELRQIKRAREIGLGAGSGVSVKESGSEKIAKGVASALKDLTSGKTAGITGALGGGQ